MSARSLVYGSRHMLVAGHPLAATAGLEALQQGGTFVDAAIAAAAVITVVLPNASTIGGDAFMLVHEAGKPTIGLNGSGPCPSSYSPADFPAGIPRRGPQSATVPALVRAWHDVHVRFGKLPWNRLFTRAIQHAEEGFPLSDDVARSIQLNRALLEKDPGCADMFLRDGGLRAGEIFRQPGLASTLQAVADQGVAGFCEGRVPEALSRCVVERGGGFRSADFPAVTTEWTEPLAIDHGGLTIQVMPPNSVGLFLLVQLRLLARSGIDWTAVGDEERLAALMLATERTLKTARPWIADPRTSVRARRPDIEALVALAEAVPDPTSLPPNPGGTSIISVADSEGNGIVLVQSVFQAWGAGVLDRETGVLLNNRLSGFSHEPGHDNAIAPGKRPAHTLCPVMAIEPGGRLRYLTGSPGGLGQTITDAQVLTNLIDRRMGIAESIHAPRWSADLNGAFILEDEFPDALLAALSRRGLAVRRGPYGTPYFGSAQVIELRANGTLAGVADHRREDCLLAG
jgi:gamma-glutamyltranspeptidase/glutathione hydrolase